MAEDKEYQDKETLIDINDHNKYIPKFEKIQVSDTGPWIVTYSGDGTLAVWKIPEGANSEQFGDIELSWSCMSVQGSFVTITVSPDGNYAAGYFDNDKEIIVYSSSAILMRKKMEEDSDCIPTFLPSGQLALLTDRRLELLGAPFSEKEHIFSIPSTDEFWRRYDQPLHRGIIYRFEPNNYISLWSITSGGGLIRYIQTGITEWNRAGIAISQSGTLVALYCDSHFTILHAATGMLAASFEWPQIIDYPQNLFFDFVNGDRFLVGCFSDDGKNIEAHNVHIQMWRWDMDNASLWTSETITSDTNSTYAVFPRNKGIIIDSYADEGLQKWKPRIMQTVKGEVKPVKSGMPAYYINQSDTDQTVAATPGLDENDDRDDYLDEGDGGGDSDGEIPYDRDIPKKTFDVQRIEPWLASNEKLGMAYLLDEDHRIQLLVGLTTIQLWRTQYILPPDETQFRELLHIWHVPKPSSIPGSGVNIPAESAPTVQIKRSEDEPEIKFIIHEKALSVRVVYDDSGTTGSELFHLPISNPRSGIQYKSSIPSSHREQLLIHAWHALVSYWTPMTLSMTSTVSLGRKPSIQGTIKCCRCKSLQPPRKCRMSETGCLECWEIGRFCPTQTQFYVIDGIYDLVMNGISLHWELFARITGAIFYMPIFKGKHGNFHEYLQLTEFEHQLPSSLFCTPEMVAQPLLRSVETGNTGRVRDFLEYMVRNFTYGAHGRKELGFVYPITQSLLALDQKYPDLIITIMESSNYIEATTDDPLRESDATIMPGLNFRSDRTELHAFATPERLSTSTIIFPEINVLPQINQWRGQGRPVTLCLVPFMDINSTSEYVYDEPTKMIIKKRLTRSIFAKLALHGGSGFFGTPVSEAILNSKWDSGAKTTWIIFFALHILYYTLFCLTIPSYIPWNSTLYPLREAFIVIYIFLGVLFYFKGEVQQLLYGSWYSQSVKNPHANRKSIFHSARDYFASFYNWVDTAAYFFPVITGLYTLITHQQCPNPASAFAVLILWFHFLLQLRIFKQLGKYITILIEIGKSIGWLLIIIMILIFAFAHAIFSLMYGYTPEAGDDSEAFITIDRTLRTTWFFLSGDWSPADNYHDNRSLAILTILFSFLTVIVFINVLIAIMSSIVEDMQMKADRIWLQMYAQIVAEMEVYWTLKKHNRPDIVYYEASTELYHQVKRERNNDKENNKDIFL